MRRGIFGVVLATAWTLLCPSFSLAQEHHADGESAEEAFHKNHLSVFTCGTTEFSEG